MSVRWKVWTPGLIATVSLVIGLAVDKRPTEWIVPLALLSLAVCALFAEGAALRSLSRDPILPSPPENAKSADGVVDVVPITGVEGQINPESPGFRRFIRLNAMSPEPETSKPLSAATPALLGHAVLISVFIGRDGVGWSDEEIARCHNALEKVGSWIEREAIRQAVPVNIGLAETYFQVLDNVDESVEIAFGPEGKNVGPMEANASLKAVAMASRAAVQLGFKDVVDLLEKINPRVESDSCVWLLHVRRAGRSLAIPASQCDVSGVGLAICFSREASFPEPLVGSVRIDSTTIAHELLHLFGASDKYGVELRSFPKGSVSSRDIMRLNHDTLSRMTVDGLTASELGWSEP